MIPTHCIGCGGTRLAQFLDLGEPPLANAYLRPEDAHQQEPRFALRVGFCPDCFLVQLLDRVDPAAMFSHYLYFSSNSDAFVAHAREEARWLTETRRLSSQSLVVELASNDGYLLQFFKEAGVPVLGVDPARNVAEAANARGIPTRCAFFSLAEAGAMLGEGVAADAVLGNNVLAHVPDPVDFLKGAALLLKPGGVVVFEFPHLLPFLEKVEFDTIYHEHASYFSLLAITELARRAGLVVTDVSEQPVHGGSLRVSLQKEGSPGPAVSALLAREQAAGLDKAETFARFGEQVRRVVSDLRAFLQKARQEGRRVAAYGAAAKGNTLLNVARLGPADLCWVADRSPHKQGHLTPGAHLPIVPAEKLLHDKPDYVLLLAWNFEEEIRAQQREYLAAGGRFVVAVPVLRVDGA